LQQYRDGRLSHEAKLIYEALLEHGPQHVIELRRLARLTGQSRTAAFQRALAELQADLKILPVGVARAGAWHYAFIYEIVSRWYPDLSERARPIGGDQARRTLLATYLDNVITATVHQAARLFGWVKRDVERAAAQLTEAGRIATEVRIEGLRGKHLVSAKTWEEA
jgi:hypothetical protein